MIIAMKIIVSFVNVAVVTARLLELAEVTVAEQDEILTEAGDEISIEVNEVEISTVDGLHLTGLIEDENVGSTTVSVSSVQALHSGHAILTFSVHNKI